MGRVLNCLVAVTFAVALSTGEVESNFNEADVIISEKRDKKGAKFTTAGVPYPFKSREQFERSLRNPLGTEWNTADSHAALTQPKVKATRGAVAAPISKRHKGAPAPLKIK